MTLPLSSSKSNFHKLLLHNYSLLHTLFLIVDILNSLCPLSLVVVPGRASSAPFPSFHINRTTSWYGRVNIQGREEGEHGREMSLWETTEVAGHISTTNSLPPSAEMQIWRSLWMFPALLQAKTTELAHTTTCLGLPEMRVCACIVSFH